MSLVDVGAEADFAEGVFRILSVEKREVGVLRWRGNWFAVRNICPHIGGPLCAGPIQSHITEGTAWSGDLVVDPTRPVLMCPWHRWEFDLRTGEGVTGGEHVRTYPVTIADGRVLIEASRSRAPAA
jgi:nitrite reductase (NADH) small subunit